MNQELYDSIRESIGRFIRLETDEENLFLHEVTLLAVDGAHSYVKDLEESVGHLRETIKRLTKE